MPAIGVEFLTSYFWLFLVVLNVLGSVGFALSRSAIIVPVSWRCYSVATQAQIGHMLYYAQGFYRQGGHIAMATLEERVSTLEEAFEHDFRAPFEAVMSKVDELSRHAREHGQDIREIKMRLGVMDARLGGIDTRLNALDEKFDSLRADVTALRADMNAKFAHLDAKLDQVIALLTQSHTK